MTVSGRVTQESWVRDSCHQGKSVPEPWARCVTWCLLARQLCHSLTSKPGSLCTPHPAWTVVGCAARWGLCYQEEQRGIGWESPLDQDKRLKLVSSREKMKKGLQKPGERWMLWRVMRNAPSCCFKALHWSQHARCSPAPWGHGADQFVLNNKTERDKNLPHQGKSQHLTFMTYFLWCCIFSTHTGKCAWISIQTICTIK